MTSARVAFFGLVICVSMTSLTACDRTPDRAEVPAGNIAKPPSVVLILVDTLRADRVEAQRNGVPVMPHLHALARESWYFTNAVSQSSWTKPSMVSLFTSLYPEVHNVLYAVVNDDSAEQLVTSVVPERIRLIQTYLKSHGYATAAVQSNGMLEGIGFARDFDEYYFKNYAAGFRADQVTDTALKQLDELKSPFFLYVHYMDPHARYAPPLRYQEAFGPLPPLDRADVELLDRWEDYYWDQWRTNAGIQPERTMAEMSPTGRERLRTLYDAEARFVDEEVNRLVETVRSQHPRSLIVITADHGEELWDHGGVGHARTLYDELIRVPLVISGPGVPANRDATPVELVDVAPTIAALVGLDSPATWQGRRLPAPSKGNAAEARPQFSYNRTARKAPGIEQRSVRVGRYKLIRYEHENETMLFDVERDPAEQVNRASQNPGEAADLLSVIQAQEQRNSAHASRSAGEAEPFVDEATQEAIRALGYLK